MALHEAMLVPAFMHCSVVIVWKEKERLRSMDVQMGSFRVVVVEWDSGKNERYEHKRVFG